MGIYTPKFGIKVPSETSRFSNLGRELREFGQSIEDVLASFNYNGADPDLLLSRVAALEAWRMTAQATLAGLATVATLDPSTIVRQPGLTVNPGLELRKNGNGQVSGYIDLNKNSDFQNGIVMVTLPVGWRPTATREYVGVVSKGSDPIPTLLQIHADGRLILWRGPTSWAGGRTFTAQVVYYAAP